MQANLPRSCTDKDSRAAVRACHGPCAPTTRLGRTCRITSSTLSSHTRPAPAVGTNTWTGHTTRTTRTTRNGRTWSTTSAARPAATSWGPSNPSGARRARPDILRSHHTCVISHGPHTPRARIRIRTGTSACTGTRLLRRRTRISSSPSPSPRRLSCSPTHNRQNRNNLRHRLPRPRPRLGRRPSLKPRLRHRQPRHRQPRQNRLCIINPPVAQLQRRFIGPPWKRRVAHPEFVEGGFAHEAEAVPCGIVGAHAGGEAGLEGLWGGGEGYLAGGGGGGADGGVGVRPEGGGEGAGPGVISEGPVGEGCWVGAGRGVKFLGW